MPQALAMFKLPELPGQYWMLRDYVLQDARGARELYEFEVDGLLAGRPHRRVNDLYWGWGLGSGPLHFEFHWLWYWVASDWGSKPAYDLAGNWYVPRTFEHIATMSCPKHPLPDDLLDRLKRVEPLWHRAFVYVRFTEARLGRAWCDRFLADLRAAVRVVPVATMDQWLTQLDAEDFRQRDQASRNFAAHRDQCRAHLEAAERNARAPEVRLRITELLKVPPAPAAPFEEEFLEAVKYYAPGSAAARVRAILCDGAAGLPAVEKAKALRREDEETERVFRTLSAGGK
ncbi:hypothetical protein [Fimbriiglobus ruber]|uniref:Uncharacterized protein n=1 Tax=Fimbriiglobus ruber TaxID=1908690 RepID=A0A225E3W6_9BACT|nr:hypothetical protein [Fimbriiglobus ruber]OWK45488.1 hypothetical protein FRUB_01819 [Fimbriiglobus ruber]